MIEELQVTSLIGEWLRQDRNQGELTMHAFTT
jgi:hypothetical protein